MANLLILAPAPIAAVTSSRGSGVENLLTPDPREVWADVESDTAATINIDLGAARAIDTVFLGHVTPPAAEAIWTISGGLDAPTETTLLAPKALRAPDVAGEHPALSHAFWHGELVTLRYLRITLTQPLSAEPLTAGVVLVGRSFSPVWNHEWESGRRPIDTGSSTPLASGGFAVVEGVRKSSWSWTLGDLTDAELDRLYAITLNRGDTRPLLVVEDPASTPGLRRRLHYGLFRQLRQFTRLSKGRTRWELTIEDWGGDEAAAP